MELHNQPTNQLPWMAFLYRGTFFPAIVRGEKQIPQMEDRYDLYLEAKSWEKAAEAAVRLKDPRYAMTALQYNSAPSNAARCGIFIFLNSCGGASFGCDVLLGFAFLGFCVLLVLLGVLALVLWLLCLWM